MDVFPKFIIEDGNIIVGKCTFHKNLTHDPSKVIGGGWWLKNEEKKEITFYGESQEFGTVKLEDIKEIVKAKKVFTSWALCVNLSDKYTFKYRTPGWEIIKL